MKKTIWIIVVVILLIGIIWIISVKPSSAPTTIPIKVETLTMAKVAQHGDASSCYTRVGDKVYDLTKWINEHPGGRRAILSICGKDGTEAFARQHGSSQKAQTVLASFYLANLAQ